jgi:hypothetical protein
MEDKVEELDKTVKDHERMLRKYEWSMGVEGEEIQTKGIDNLFNRKIAENFPNSEKEIVTVEHKAYRTPNHQDQKRNTSRHIITKMLNTKNKEF